MLYYCIVFAAIDPRPESPWTVWDSASSYERTLWSMDLVLRIDFSALVVDHSRMEEVWHDFARAKGKGDCPTKAFFDKKATGDSESETYIF